MSTPDDSTLIISPSLSYELVDFRMERDRSLTARVAEYARVWTPEPQLVGTFVMPGLLAPSGVTFWITAMARDSEEFKRNHGHITPEIEKKLSEWLSGFFLELTGQNVDKTPEGEAGPN